MPRIFPAYMGNSQYLFLPIMQIADIFGVTAVTFLIYRVNAVGFLWVRSLWEGRSRPVRSTMITALLMATVTGYGLVRMYQIDHQIAQAKTLDIVCR